MGHNDFTMLVALILIIRTVYGANILGIMPVPSRSHSILIERLMITLAEKGHNVTFVNTYNMSQKYANLKEITLRLSSDDMMSGVGVNFFMMGQQSAIEFLYILPKFGSAVCEKQIQSEEFQGLINSDSTFVILAGDFMIESLNAGLTEKFKAPLITFHTQQPNHIVNYMTGNIAPTSFIPDLYLGFPQRMTFTQRMANLLYITASSLIHHYYHLPKQDVIYKKYFGNGKETPMMEHVNNVSLVFTNDHYSLTFSRPLVPNIIPIGGIHVSPVKNLPQDLQEYVDSSKNGVILFSMGTNLKSSRMPKEKIAIFLKVFSRLKQNMLWKFEEDLERKSSNVIISKWLPQSDILGHPNVKLFITHGGLLSTIEAIDRGVPIIGIPIFGDQHENMKHSVNSGVGLSLSYDTMTEESLMNAIQEVIENPGYSEAAKLRSTLLRDQQNSQMDTAVFWIEYVIRHRGAKHLRPMSLDLTWYEAYQVDVIVVLVTFVILLLKLAVFSVRYLAFKMFNRKKKTNTTSVKDKNK